MDCNYNHWSPERVRRISILSRKPAYKALLYTIPKMLEFAALYPDTLLKFNEEGHTIPNDILTCDDEPVKVGSVVSYYKGNELLEDTIVTQNNLFGLSKSNLFYDSLQNLVDIHVYKVISF